MMFTIKIKWLLPTCNCIHVSFHILYWNQNRYIMAYNDKLINKNLKIFIKMIVVQSPVIKPLTPTCSNYMNELYHNILLFHSMAMHYNICCHIFFPLENAFFSINYYHIAFIDWFKYSFIITHVQIYKP